MIELKTIILEDWGLKILRKENKDNKKGRKERKSNDKYRMIQEREENGKQNLIGMKEGGTEKEAKV